MKQSVFSGMEYVYEVYKQKSFIKAAETLYISQPSISASVKRVEDRIGSPIFDRSMKPLQLTECGKRYIENVETIMALEREFSEYVNDFEGLRLGKIILGGSSLFSSLVLPPLMAAFRQRHPQIQLELLEESTIKLEEMLRIGLVDMVVDYTIPNESKYDSKVVEEDSLILAVPKSNPINSTLSDYQIASSFIGTASQNSIPVVPLEEFQNETFILLKHGNDTRERADALCNEAGFSPKVVMEFDQQMTAYHVGCSGAGISFVSSFMVSKILPNPMVCYYRLSSPISQRQVKIFWKQARYVTRAMEAFLSTTPTS